MKLKYLKEGPLLTLKENIFNNYENYFKPDASWVLENADDKEPFGEFKIEAPEFKLCTDSEEPSETDPENVRRLYTALRFLTETQAADERLWVGLAHGQFWGYMQYRWPAGKKRPTPQNIKRRFFYALDKRRSLYTNTLARLWWVGKMVYDEQSAEPFGLMDFFKTDFATKALVLSSSNFTSNPSISRPLLRAFKNYQDRGFIIGRSIWNEVLKNLNKIGGAYILDYLSEDELYERIETQITMLLNIGAKAAA